MFREGPAAIFRQIHVWNLLHECENIVAIKEASGDMTQIMRIIRDKPDNFSVISGDDMMTIPIIAAGGSGVISVLANAFPAATSELVNFALKSNFKPAREIQLRYLEMIELLFIDGNPAGVKAMLSYNEYMPEYLKTSTGPCKQDDLNPDTKSN